MTFLFGRKSGSTRGDLLAARQQRHRRPTEPRDARFEFLEKRILLASDFGDAPLPYPTTLAEGGAEHVLAAGGPQLGVAIDAETDGVHAPAADGDGADDDGVSFGTMRVGMLDATATVHVEGLPGKIDAWIDFNGDGSWGGPGEQIFDSRVVNPGANFLTFDVPSAALTGTTFARFRVSTAGNLGYGGLAADGEVEDYEVAIESPASSLGAFSGARNVVIDAEDPWHLVSADVDGDGDLDVVSASIGDDTIAWHENDGSQNFTEHAISNTADGAWHVSAADIDGDGDVDVLGVPSNDHEIIWYDNDGNENFTTRVIVTGGEPFLSVHAADIDGDGDLDVLGAVPNDDEIVWFENDGGQAFAARTISRAVDVPLSVFAADVDRDGDLDVLSASRDDDRIAWHENDGSQNFTMHTISTSAVQAQGVFAADIDGDGDLDVLSASSFDDKIAWYENDGNQSFSAHTIALTDRARSVFAADMDGDGDLDVLSGSIDLDGLSGFVSGSSIAWHENDGNQNFTSRPIETTDYPLAIHVADFDGDRDLDLLAGISSSEKIVWYENLNHFYDFSDPAFRAVEADVPYTTTVVTLQRTGATDAATQVDVVLTGGTADVGSDFSAGPITVHFGVGETTQPVPIEILGDTLFEIDEAFALSLTAPPGGSPGILQPTAVFTIADDEPGDFGDAPAPYPTTRLRDGARHEASGPTLGTTRDVESDGVPSPSASGEGADDDGVTFGTIQAGALDATVTIVVQGSAAKVAAWIDFNGDGSWGGPGEQILASRDVNPGINHFTFDVPSDARAGIAYARVRVSSAGKLGVAGLASDGEVEDYQIVIAGPTAASGYFGQQNTITTRTDDAVSVHAADVDGDGDIDVLSASPDDDWINWFENDGHQNFTRHPIDKQIRSPLGIAATDVDGDGDLDLLVTYPFQVAWFENDGNQNFTHHLVASTQGVPLSAIASDMDGDGDLDIVGNGQQEDEIAWYENDGDQDFTPRTIATLTITASSVDVADIDGDGDLDVLGAFYSNGIGWFENDSRQNFTARFLNTGNDGAFDVSAADVDGDGDLDIVSTSDLDEFAAWHENDGSQNFAFRLVTTSLNGANRALAADIDGDGDVDVVSSAFFDDRISWHENDGNQNFTTRTIANNVNGAWDVFAADVDGDGDLDVLSASRFDNKIAWYENLIVDADFNDNQQVNGKDLLAWQRGFGTGSPHAAPADGDADLDQDVDGDDLSIWQQQYDAAADGSADFDSNGQVEGIDLLAWQRGLSLLAPNAVKSDGDADGDLDVDAVDLIVWESQYGQTNSQVAFASGESEAAHSTGESSTSNRRAFRTERDAWDLALEDLFGNKTRTARFRGIRSA